MSRMKKTLSQLRRDCEGLNEEEMLVMSESMCKRMLDISRIVAPPQQVCGNKQRQISQLVHRIACHPNICKRIKDMASLALSQAKTQVIMDHLQDVSGEEMIP